MVFAAQQYGQYANPVDPTPPLMMGQYTVLVDWNGDGAFTNGYANITTNVFGVQTTRGRNYASQLTGRSVAGRATITLDNRDGKFSSYNSASPVYGKILPNRQVIIYSNSPVTQTMWTGFLDHIDVTTGGRPMATLYAVGAFNILGSQSNLVSPLPLSGVTTDAVVTAILNAANWPVAARSIQTGYVPVGNWFKSQAVALGCLQEMEDTEGGFLYEGGSWDIGFQNRYHRMLNSSVSQGIFTDAVAIWPAATNLVTNGGFETNTTGYTAFGTGAFARDATVSKFGGASGKLTVNANIDGVGYPITLTPGTTYTLSAWVMVPTGKTLALRFLDGLGTPAYAAVGISGATGVWQRVSVTAVCGAAGAINLQLFDTAISSYPYTMNIDGVQVETGSIATPYIETNGATASVAATYHYEDIGQQDPIRDIYNRITAAVTGYNVAVAATVLWTLANSTPTLSPGSSITVVASFTSVYVGAWTTPVVGTDVVQTGGVNGDLAVAVVKGATAMKITLTNNGATTMSITLLQARGTAATAQNSYSTIAEDTASQTAYGLRAYPLASPWYPSTVYAQAACDKFVADHKDPHPVLALTLHAGTDPDLFVQAVTRNLSDRITVIASQALTELGISAGDFFIESITHKFGARTPLRTIWTLSPADVAQNYFRFDVGKFDVDKLGY